MDVAEAIILSIKKAGSNRICRTSLQKLLYFERELGVLDADYSAHYYGPYSSEVAETSSALVNLNLIIEDSEQIRAPDIDYPFGWYKYCYSLAPDGELYSNRLLKKGLDATTIERVVTTCENMADLDPNTLSWAAKVHFILGNYEVGTVQEIIDLAAEKKWRISAQQISTAFDLLIALDMVPTGS